MKKWFIYLALAGIGLCRISMAGEYFFSGMYAPEAGGVVLDVGSEPGFTNGLDLYCADGFETSHWALAASLAPQGGTFIPWTNWSPGLQQMLVLGDAQLDSDQDGLPDARERLLHATREDIFDSDGDAIGDGWELGNGLNPLNGNDGALDGDGDGLSNTDEFRAGSPPGESNAVRTLPSNQLAFDYKSLDWTATRRGYPAFVASQPVPRLFLSAYKTETNHYGLSTGGWGWRTREWTYIVEPFSGYQTRILRETGVEEYPSGGHQVRTEYEIIETNGWSRQATWEYQDGNLQAAATSIVTNAYSGAMEILMTVNTNVPSGDLTAEFHRQISTWSTNGGGTSVVQATLSGEFTVEVFRGAMDNVLAQYAWHTLPWGRGITWPGAITGAALQSAQWQCSANGLTGRMVQIQYRPVARNVTTGWVWMMEHLLIEQAGSTAAVAAVRHDYVAGINGDARAEYGFYREGCTNGAAAQYPVVISTELRNAAGQTGTVYAGMNSTQQFTLVCTGASNLPGQVVWSVSTNGLRAVATNGSQLVVQGLSNAMHNASGEWVRAVFTPQGGSAAVTAEIRMVVARTDLAAYGACRSSDGTMISESEEHDPGFLIIPDSDGSWNPYEAKIVARASGAATGVVRQLRFSHPSYVRLWRSGWPSVITPGSQFTVTGAPNADLDFEITTSSSWQLGTHVTVELVCLDPQGNVLSSSDVVKPIPPVIMALGDSMTYGMQRLKNGTFMTPRWDAPWSSYPDSEWGSVGGNRYSADYQGWRGYLQSSLSGFWWLGEDTKGHGPGHEGYPGAHSDHIIIGLGTSGRYPYNAFISEHCYAIIIYYIGLNDIIGGESAGSLYNSWVNALNTALNLRAGRGRNLVIGVTLPKMRSDYSGYSSAKQAQLVSLNSYIRGHGVSHSYTRYAVAEHENITHDANDDGLHYLATGYGNCEYYIRTAIRNNLQ